MFEAFIFQSSSSPGWISDLFFAFVTWFLVVAGWAIVNDQKKYQEISKASQQRFDSLRILLDEVEKCAVAIQREAYDETKNRRVRRLLKKISFECALLADCGALDAQWTVKMILFRRAVTWNSFDKSGFVQQNPDSLLVGQIESAKDEFEVYLVRMTLGGLHRARSLWDSIRACAGPSR